jgi:hypothetical protein
VTIPVAEAKKGGVLAVLQEPKKRTRTCLLSCNHNIVGECAEQRGHPVLGLELEVAKVGFSPRFRHFVGVVVQKVKTLKVRYCV